MRDLTEKQVEDIHHIIERHSTDVIDYEGATDDINAYLFGGIKQPESDTSLLCWLWSPLNRWYGGILQQVTWLIPVKENPWRTCLRS